MLIGMLIWMLIGSVAPVHRGVVPSYILSTWCLTRSGMYHVSICSVTTAIFLLNCHVTTHVVPTQSCRILSVSRENTPCSLIDILKTQDLTFCGCANTINLPLLLLRIS